MTARVIPFPRPETALDRLVTRLGEVPMSLDVMAAWEEDDRRFADAIARCKASEARTLAWISTGSGACPTSGPDSK